MPGRGGGDELGTGGGPVDGIGGGGGAVPGSGGGDRFGGGGGGAGMVFGLVFPHLQRRNAGPAFGTIKGETKWRGVYFSRNSTAMGEGRKQNKGMQSV